MTSNATANGANGTVSGTRRTYSEQEVEQALSALAAVDGNTRRAASELAGEGLPVSTRTLARWRRSKPELYARVRVELVPHVRAARRQRYRTIARRMVGVSTPREEVPHG